MIQCEIMHRELTDGVVIKGDAAGRPAQCVHGRDVHPVFEGGEELRKLHMTPVLVNRVPLNLQGLLVVSEKIRG